MAAKVTRENLQRTAKAPGTLIVTAYAACPDITGTVTPDIKEPGKSRLMLMDLRVACCGWEGRLWPRSTGRSVMSAGRRRSEGAPEMF